SASCSPTCSTVLTINTSGSTPTGSYPIMVSASGGGVTRTTSFTLSVGTAVALVVATPTITPNGGQFFGLVGGGVRVGDLGEFDLFHDRRIDADPIVKFIYRIYDGH